MHCYNCIGLSKVSMIMKVANTKQSPKQSHCARNYSIKISKCHSTSSWVLNEAAHCNSWKPDYETEEWIIENDRMLDGWLESKHRDNQKGRSSNSGEDTDKLIFKPKKRKDNPIFVYGVPSFPDQSQPMVYGVDRGNRIMAYAVIKNNEEWK